MGTRPTYIKTATLPPVRYTDREQIAAGEVRLLVGLLGDGCANGESRSQPCLFIRFSRRQCRRGFVFANDGPDVSGYYFIDGSVFGGRRGDGGHGRERFA